MQYVYTPSSLQKHRVNVKGFYRAWTTPSCSQIPRSVRYRVSFAYKQHWWSCCGTSDVLSRGHPSSCVSNPRLVHSQEGGGGVHTVRRGWVSSLFNQIQQDELLAAWPRFLTVVLSLPVQKTVASLTVLELLCNRSPRERSTFSNLCLHTLTGVLRISLFFLSLVSYHGTVNSMTIWSSSSVLTKAPCPA